MSLACSICGAQYTGISWLTAHICRPEHLAAVRRGDTVNAIRKHYALKNPDMDGETKPFTFTILKTPRLVWNLQRYIVDTLKIREVVRGPVWHFKSKGEWAMIPLRRQVIL